MMTNAINWFEIPATDFQRAVTFYGAIFETSLQHVRMDGFDMGMFPYKQGEGIF